MSRSYKKTPVCKCEKTSKPGKKMANRKIRRSFKNGVEIGNHNAYKKHFESYDICDYKSYWSKEDATKTYEKRLAEAEKDPKKWDWFFREYPTLELWLQYWKHSCLRK